MPKPSMPNIPGMGAMTDTLDFVKNLWGGMSIPGMNIPGMVMPSLSVEEINKQISDLKAVESWLTLNMNMLRGTIQALEVQSATIATLQSMSETLNAAVKPNVAQKASKEDPAATNEGAYSFSKTTEKSALDPKPESSTQSKADVKAESASSAAPPLANPAVWWNILQDQFKQAVNTALASEKTEATPAPAAPRKPATKPAAAAAAKKASVPRKRKEPKAAEK
jgi:hypothetical protein